MSIQDQNQTQSQMKESLNKQSRLYEYKKQCEKEIVKTQVNNQKWKLNDVKAQKNGVHRTIYWVKQQQKAEDGNDKNEKWIQNMKYIGDWKENGKSGFGVQVYGNKDRYEGIWENNMRNGQGTFWKYEGNNKLRREYTGDYKNDRKNGRGTMFYSNSNRYDGMWLDDHPHGEGRMIYTNGDVYEGFWYMSSRSGYGVLTKRNGDHYEGHWVNDKREGQGSYFYNSKNQVFVGEWVDDQPKCGVYSSVDDPSLIPVEREQHYNQEYIQPSFPKIELQDPSSVLQKAMEKVRQNRTFYRARFIPLDELYNKEELNDLIKEFSVAAQEDKGVITSFIGLEAALQAMGFELTDDEIKSYLILLDSNVNHNLIHFELFARLVAILLEEHNSLNQNSDQYEKDTN